MLIVHLMAGLSAGFATALIGGALGLPVGAVAGLSVLGGNLCVVLSAVVTSPLLRWEPARSGNGQGDGRGVTVKG